MKELTNYTKEILKSPNTNTCWLLVINFSGESLRYASRSISVAGNYYENGIISLFPVSQSLPTSFGLNSTDLSASHIIKLAYTKNYTRNYFSDLYKNRAFENALCSLSILFLSPDTNPEESDIISIQTFRIQSAELDSAYIKLTVLPNHIMELSQNFLRVLEPGFYQDCDRSSVGKPLPKIFGRVCNCPLMPLATGAKSRLIKKLNPEDSVMYIEDVLNFPKYGRVQIDNEIITYMDKDENLSTLGTASSPLIRSFRLFHSAGTIVNHIPANGFLYLISDHRCLNILRIKAGGRVLSSSEYNTFELLLGGSGAHVVSFPVMPVASKNLYNETNLVIDGENFGGKWFVGENDRSVYPEKSIDAGGNKTCARIVELHPVLEVIFRGNLSEGEKIYGDFIKANLVVDMTAFPVWQDTSKLTLQLSKNDKKTAFNINRPFSNPPVRILKFDVTDFVLKNGGWGFFSGDANSPRIKIELGSFNDPAQIYIYDLSFEINYRGRLNSKIDYDIRADVEGFYTNETLIENPADIIKAIITDRIFLGKSESALDAESFQNAKNSLAARDYIFSGRIYLNNNYKSVLNNIAEESASCLFVENNKFKILLNNPAGYLEEPEFIFDKNNILNSGMREKFRQIDEMTNFYTLCFGAASNNNSTLIIKNESAIESAGLQLSKEVNLFWHNEKINAAEDLGNIMLLQTSSGMSEIIAETPLHSVAVEIGDIVSVSAGLTSPYIFKGAVIGIEIKNASVLKFAIRGYVKNSYCWEYGDSTYIEHIFNNSRKIVVIENIIAASLDSAGNLFLKGSVYEGVLSQEIMSSPVQYNFASGIINFGFGSAGNYRKVFSIDSGGNLLTVCEIEEFDALSGLVPQKCIDASENGLMLSVWNLKPVLAYVSVYNKIFLKKQIYESADPLKKF